MIDSSPRAARLAALPILVLAVGLVLGAPASGAAKVKLPSPRSTVVKPNAGVGGLELRERFKPLPRGWSGASRCLEMRNYTGCVWTRSRAALPPEGEQGIAGPFVLVGAVENRIVQITISAGDREPDAAPLRRWKTRRGIRLGSTLAAVRAAYPQAVAGGLADQFVVWGPHRRTRTNFDFVDGVLNHFEINACTRENTCD